MSALPSFLLLNYGTPFITWGVGVQLSNKEEPIRVDNTAWHFNNALAEWSARNQKLGTSWILGRINRYFSVLQHYLRQHIIMCIYYRDKLNAFLYFAQTYTFRSVPDPEVEMLFSVFFFFFEVIKYAGWYCGLAVLMYWVQISARTLPACIVDVPLVSFMHFLQEFWCLFTIAKCTGRLFC